MKFSLLGWARCTMRRVPVMSLLVWLCLLPSRISSAFCLWVLQGGAGAQASSGVQICFGVQTAVLTAASDKTYQFRSVPAFLMSLLLSPTSETLSACVICSTKSIVSPLLRDARFLLFSLLLHCNLSVLCCSGSCGHQKVFCNRTLWFAVDLANLSVTDQNLSTGKLLWSWFHWVIKQKHFRWGSAIHHLQLLSQLCKAFIPAQLWWCNLMGSSEGRAGTSLPKVPLADCTETVLRKDNYENGTDFTWVICYHRKLTVLMGLWWYCRAEIIRVITFLG